MSGHVPPSTPDEIKYFFIRRPVMAGVIAIVITVLGLVSLQYLPVNRYPSITALDPDHGRLPRRDGRGRRQLGGGTDRAAALRTARAALLQVVEFERRLDEPEVFFDISRDQDLAAVDVQNAVKLAEPQLPADVTRNGVVVTKAQTDILLVAALTSDDPRYDADYLTNYATLYVADEVKRLPGVGDATVFGGGRSPCCCASIRNGCRGSGSPWTMWRPRCGSRTRRRPPGGSDASRRPRAPSSHCR